MVEKKVGHIIERLRTSGGGEYTSTEFSQYYKMEGIEHEWITPYTP